MPRKQPLLHCRELRENSVRKGHCYGATGRTVRNVPHTTHKTVVMGRVTQKQKDFHNKAEIKRVLMEEGQEGLYRVQRALEADKMRAKQHAKVLVFYRLGGANEPRRKLNKVKFSEFRGSNDEDT